MVKEEKKNKNTTINCIWKFTRRAENISIINPPPNERSSAARAGRAGNGGWRLKRNFNHTTRPSKRMFPRRLQRRVGRVSCLVENVHFTFQSFPLYWARQVVYWDDSCQKFLSEEPNKRRWPKLGISAEEWISLISAGLIPWNLASRDQLWRAYR